tara:strand:+ start:1136 stop:1420 length:285 start_codon:yes stop_codon:yes gene_type:complete
LFAYLIVFGLVLLTLVIRLITANEIKKQQERLLRIDNAFSDLSGELESLYEEIRGVKLTRRQLEIRHSRLSGDIEISRNKLKNVSVRKRGKVAA